MPANNCQQLKTTYDQLLAEKRKFDELFNEINALRPNMSKNLVVIKDKLLLLKNSRRKLEDAKAKIEDEYFTSSYKLENNSKKIQTIIKKYSDKIFSRIEKKVTNQQELNQAEIILLYDIKKKITPRLNYDQQEIFEKILDKRDKKIDAPVVLGLRPEEIAWNENEINENTKAYIGDLFPGIFQLAKKIGIKYISTFFPEEIIIKEITIGGVKKKLIKELNKKIQAKKIFICEDAMKMIKNDDLKIQDKVDKIQIVCLQIKALGFSENANIDEVCARAEKFGLEKCPEEVGPQLILQNTDFPLKNRYYFAMKEIEIDDYGIKNISKHIFFMNSKSNRLIQGRHEIELLAALESRNYEPSKNFVFLIS